MEQAISNDRIDLNKIPMTALRQKGCLLLSQLLNNQKTIPSEDGYPRDWRGIAHLCGIQKLNETVTPSHQNPLARVLQRWYDEDKTTATFANLQKFLGIIDRWDVVDDITDILHEDAIFYLKSKDKQSTHNNSTEILMQASLSPDENIITTDDVIRARKGLPPQIYDAFVLFDDEDIAFAAKLIEKMEDYGLKLCVRERDLIGGISFEHEAILKLISDRCNRLIVIVSPAFLKSRANTFFVNFAQALGIEQGRRKIVPCLYKRCVLPPTLNFYFILNYERSGKFLNFWEKLKNSIQITPTEINVENTAICNNIPEVPSIKITEIDSNQGANSQLNKIQTSLPQKPPRKCNQKQNVSSENSMDELNINLIDCKLSSSTSTSSNYNTTREIPIQLNSYDLHTQSLSNLENLREKSHYIYDNCDIAKSNTDISKLKSQQQQQQETQPKTKNTKWYKKILSVNSIFDSSTIKNSKKRLNKKKMTMVQS